MVTPRPSFKRTIATILATIILSLMLASCGGPPARSSATHHTGPGKITLGEAREAVESRNSGWKIHATEPDGFDTIVIYKNWEWSLAYGFTHGSEYHRLTYNAVGVVIAWSSSSSPTGKE